MRIMLQLMKETILSDTAVAFATDEISFLKDHIEFHSVILSRSVANTDKIKKINKFS